MTKSRKKLVEISKPRITDIVGFTAEEHAEHYKRDYEFNKPIPARSPVSGWAYKYANEGDTSLPPKEIALIKGSPAQHKHRRDQNSYGKRPTRRNLKRG